MQKFKPIKGYEELYSITEDGIVKNSKGKILRPTMKLGYVKMRLNKNAKQKNFFVHRLVAMNFLKPVTGKNFINHKDGIKTNNHYSNLEWCTTSENHLHGYRTGLMHRRQDKYYLSTLDKEKVLEIRKLAAKGASKHELAKLMGVGWEAIHNVLTKRTWIHI